jgi:C4-dicarboxylate-specific signal transduction histidine kinase
LNSLIDHISRMPPPRLLAMCLVLVAVIGVADYQTGYEMNMAVVYLAPIFVVAWALGTHAAIVMSIICTTAWYLSMLNMHQNYTQPLLHVWDGAIHFAMFVIFGVVISRLKSALSNADERFAAVLEGLDAAVYVADDETGEVLYANEQFRRAFPEGSRLPSLPHGVREGELQAHGPSGCWYLVHSRPMRWVDGRVVSLQLATDITGRRKAEALFRQQQEKMQMTARLVTVGEMATTIAHELNQPLAAITNYSMGCVRRLKSGNWSEAELLDAMEKGAAQAERASKVVQRVRAFVARRVPNLVPCDINEVVNGIASIVSLEARQNGASIELELSESIPYVQADPLLMEQVILNLARNAIEAMLETPEAERRLTIRSKPTRGDTVEVEVVDRGRGIDPQLEANLFTPFFSTKPQGMGLGLHICRSIVEAHGGHVRVSRNADQGTTFGFSLKTVYA